MSCPPVLIVGDNPTRVWGMSAAERVRRIAMAAGCAVESAPGEGGALLVDPNYAFDPLWLRHVAAHPGTVLTIGGRPAVAHAVDAVNAAAMREAMDGGAVPPSFESLPAEGGVDLHNAELRKREPPFALPLNAGTVLAVERASYKGAYKGVTDLLTKYLWPELAFHLTRLAAALRLSPNVVTIIGIALCVAAFFAFWEGRYWLGLALGFGFMVLDTVDGKLARCTITSSKIGDVLDHGADLVHPPFWWWAWAHGLAAYGTPIAPATQTLALWVIVGGYVAGRIVEGVFLLRFSMHIHVWRRVDSRFRLVTARRNPNVVLLAGALLFGRPDVGLVLVAWWTAISVAFHIVRWAQAEIERAGGRPVLSWLG